MRSAVVHGREVLDAKRETSTTVSVAYDTFGQDYEAGGTVLAAALGFRVFLFLVPYVCFFLIVAGYVADIFDRRPEDMFRGSGIAALTANGITTGTNFSVGARIGALVLVNVQLDARRTGARGRADTPGAWAIRAVKTAGTFATISLLWSLWSSPGLGDWVGMLQRGMKI